MGRFFEHVATSARRALGDPLPAGMRRRPQVADAAPDDGRVLEEIVEEVAPRRATAGPRAAAPASREMDAPFMDPAPSGATAGARPRSSQAFAEAARVASAIETATSPARNPPAASPTRVEAADVASAAPVSASPPPRAPSRPSDHSPAPRPDQTALTPFAPRAPSPPQTARASALSAAFVVPVDRDRQSLSPDLLAAVRARLPPPARGAVAGPPPPAAPAHAPEAEQLVIDQLDVRIVTDGPPAPQSPSPRPEAPRAGAWRTTARRYLGWT